jgi:divalent metal cation (Fe/Co/Zn/Cd) transporter
VETLVHGQLLARRVRILVACTISYNVIEAAVALPASAAASSSALLGFGLDSVIEVSSAAANCTVGIALAALSLLVMPGLSLLQRRAGRELGSASAVADSKQTLLCTYMSAVLLGGLVVNSLLGWAGADPAAGLAIAAMAVRDGIQAWRGGGCCASRPR